MTPRSLVREDIRSRRIKASSNWRPTRPRSKCPAACRQNTKLHIQAGQSVKVGEVRRRGVAAAPRRRATSQAGAKAKAGARQAGASQAGASQAGASQAGASQAGSQPSRSELPPLGSPLPPPRPQERDRAEPATRRRGSTRPSPAAIRRDGRGHVCLQRAAGQSRHSADRQHPGLQPASRPVPRCGVLLASGRGPADGPRQRPRRAHLARRRSRRGLQSQPTRLPPSRGRSPRARRAVDRQLGADAHREDDEDSPNDRRQDARVVEPPARHQLRRRRRHRTRADARVEQGRLRRPGHQAHLCRS